MAADGKRNPRLNQEIRDAIQDWEDGDESDYQAIGFYTILTAVLRKYGLVEAS